MKISDRDSDPNNPSLRRRRSTAGGDRTDSMAAESEAPAQGPTPGVQEGVPLKFAYRPYVPAHLGPKESPLSSNAIFKQSHAGLFNLCIVVLFAVNGRLIIENIMKVVIFLHTTLTTVAVLYPVFMILSFDSVVLSGVTLMLFACVVWLKLVSFAHTNYDLRELAKLADKGDVSASSLVLGYPSNVSFNSLLYFMVAPTLCYQPSYPRTENVRKGWVVRQLVKLVIFTGLMGFIIEQYMNPIVQNSQHPLTGNLLYASERVLKLSVPTLYVWLCMFYSFFHLWLNILAELLRFGDREFYKDWWNAKTVEEYWRMWNMPVHKWLVRHVYFPCLRKGMPKVAALFIVFIVSAIFHELCIAVPCHMFKLWAFIGIMFQIPLVFITNYLQSKFQNSMVGNIIFWCVFCIFGQPMCVLLYYHDMMNREIRTQ